MLKLYNLRTCYVYVFILLFIILLEKEMFSRRVQKIFTRGGEGGQKYSKTQVINTHRIELEIGYK